MLKTRVSRLARSVFLAAVAAGNAGIALAEVRVAIPDFELNDLAGVVPTPAAEIERTASLAPLLREGLTRRGYTVVPISAAELRQANVGFGY